MSAIYGIVNKKGDPVDAGMISKIRQALQHREVKGYGELAENNVAFGFFKLGVYQQSEVGDIPLKSGSAIITANAHLHNRAELCQKLSIDHKQADQYSDAYLIANAYQKWGTDCVHHLEGEFAYAIWDTELKEMLLSIDQIGYKPLYYYETAEYFIFCSEIKGIEAVKETPNYFNDECLVQFVMYHRDWNGTYNKEIYPLYGGSLLHLKNGSSSISKYWELQPTGKYSFSKHEDWYDCLYDLFYRSVENRLNTDVNIGISLSGGLDSGAIACIISDVLKKKNKSLLAFSSVLPNTYQGSLTDEKDYISIVSKHCGNIINFYETASGQSLLEEAETRFDIDEAIPLSSQVMNFAILEAAKRENVQIFFTGGGGDFWVSAQGHSALNGLLSKHQYGEAIRVFKQVKKANGLTSWQTLKRFVLLETTAAKKYYYKRVNWKNKTCLQPKYDNRIVVNSNIDSAEMMALINKGIVGRVVQRLDSRSEFYSMASANPCLDFRLMEFLADVPLQYFLADGEQRGLFRNAMRRIVPKEVIERKDKKFYMIDFSERLNLAAGLLNSTALDKNTLCYFSQDRIIKLIADINNNDLAAHGYRIMPVRAWQVLMADSVIKKLIKKSYHFS